MQGVETLHEHPPLRHPVDLRPGDHLCCLFRSDDEHRALIIEFIRMGLEQGQRVLYVHAANQPETLIGYLAAAGVAAAPYMEREQLLFVDAHDAYLRGGEFDPRAMIALLQSETTRALAAGFSALRVTGEMSWSLGGHPGSQRLLEYETLLNLFIPNHPCLGLCQYDQRLFDASVLLPVLAAHPIVAVGVDLYDNPHFISPEQIRDGDVSGAILEQWLQSIAHQQRTAASLQDTEDRYRMLFEQSVDAVFATTRDGEMETANPATFALFGYAPTEMLGMDVRQLYADPANRLAFQTLVEAQGFVRDYDVRVRRKDGALLDCQMTVTVRRGPNGQPQGYNGIVRDVTRHKRAEAERQRLLHDLDNRVRELTALRRLAELLQSGPAVDAAIIQAVAEILPPAFQHADVAAARVRYGHLVAATALLRVTPWRLATAFSTSDGQEGLLEVFYREQRPAAHDGPFLVEERHLIDAAAEMLRSYCERQRAESELWQANRALVALSACNQALVHATSETELLHNICHAIVEQGGYRLAWVGFAEHDEAKTIRPVAQVGYEDGYLETLQVTWVDCERGRGPAGSAIRLAQPVVVRDIPHDPQFAPWRQEAVKRGYASTIALPMAVGTDPPLGVLAIYAAQPTAFDAAEVNLLRELAADLAYGITNLRLRAESERAAAALQESEQRLQAVLDNTISVVYVRDLEGRYLLVNQRFEELCGIPVEAAVGRTSAEVLSPEWAEQFRDTDERALSATTPLLFEQELTDATGTRTFLTTKFVLRDAAGQPYAVCGMSTDITQRKRTEAQIRRQVQRLTALRTIDMAITSSFDQRLTLGTVLEQVTRLLGVDAAAIFLLNPHTLILDFAAGRGFRTGTIRKHTLRMGRGIAGMACLERRSVHVPNLAVADPPFVRRTLLAEEDFVSYWAVPLIVKGQVRGLMECFNRLPKQTDEDWMEFLEALGGQAAVAIDNAQLFAELQRSNTDLLLTYDTTLEVWVRMLDMHHREVASQTPRIVAATERLSRAMGIAEADLVHIRRGAMLHDVGMAALPDSIVLKPAPLTPAEWGEVRQHPAHAYGMLSTIPYLRLAAEIPYCHHERWDGSGYPRGLQGEQIPLAARIFAVVDTWDALLSHRPYRRAWTPDQVLEHIVSGAGSLFDPAVVALFQRLLPELNP